MDKEYKSGIVAMIGRPNAGKSTLLNQLMGQKLAITSDKPQTTRNSIRGIYTTDKMQAVFIDTPGVQKPKDALNQRMMRSVRDSLEGSDLLLYLVDVTAEFGGGEEFILNILSSQKLPVFLIINKIDLLKPEQILPLISLYNQKFKFAETIPLSALTGDGSEILKQLIYQYLPVGPQLYPPDLLSDDTEEQLFAELIREQILRQTEDEIPHSVAVKVERVQERASGRLYIDAVIYVERDSQKGIIIGKRGDKLKTIATAARQEMERLLGCGVYLDLLVKLKKNWRNDERILRDIDSRDE